MKSTYPENEKVTVFISDDTFAKFNLNTAKRDSLAKGTRLTGTVKYDNTNDAGEGHIILTVDAAREYYLRTNEITRVYQGFEITQRLNERAAQRAGN